MSAVTFTISQVVSTSNAVAYCSTQLTAAGTGVRARARPRRVLYSFLRPITSFFLKDGSENMNQSKSWFFEKINTLSRPLITLTSTKWSRHKRPTSERQARPRALTPRASRPARAHGERPHTPEPHDLVERDAVDTNYQNVYKECFDYAYNYSRK